MKNERLALGLCLVCQGSSLLPRAQVWDTRFGIPATYEIQVCSACTLEQTTPVPNATELKKLYEAHYNFGGEKGTRYTKLREAFFSSGLNELWLRLDGDISFYLKKGQGRLLDVGCNEGRGLHFYRRNGFEAEGLELNDKAADVARRAGFSVHPQLLEDFQPTERYDVVVLSNVLEHSLDPFGMAQHIHRLLKPGGKVLISCPNSKSFLRSLFGSYWINWHVPFHIVHFSADTLNALLRGAGFDEIAIHQQTPALWVAHSLIARLFAQQGQPTTRLRSAFLVAGSILAIRGLLFPFLFLANILGRGDCLVVSARKA